MITYRMDGTTLVVAPEDKLDATIESAASEIIDQHIAEANDVAFDMSNVEYISSAGIRVVVSAMKQLKGRGEVKIINANEAIIEIFDLVGLRSLIEFE